jgi:hypothetical protein
MATELKFKIPPELMVEIMDKEYTGFVLGLETETDMLTIIRGTRGLVKQLAENCINAGKEAEEINES